MSAQQPQNIGYGFSSPLIKVNPEPIVSSRDPMVSDRAQIGTTWINQSTNTFWVLTSIADAISYWELGGGSGAVDIITTDAGVAIPSAGNINVVGGQNTNTAAAGSTLTVNLNPSVDISGSFTAGGDIETENTDNDEYANSLILAKKRGNNTVQFDDTLGSLRFYAWDGTSYNESAKIDVTAQPGVLPGDVPGQITFYTKPNTNPLAARVVIEDDGTTVFNNPDLIADESVLAYKAATVRNNANNADGSVLNMQKIRTLAAAQSGDIIGAIAFSAFDGSDYTTGSFFGATIDGTVGAGEIPTRLGFGTQAIGSALTERMAITPEGNVIINEPVSGDALEAHSDVSFLNDVNDANPVTLTLEKNRAGAAVQDLDALGNISFKGFDGTSYIESAFVGAVVDGTVGTGDVPCGLIFGTAPTGSAAQQRMGITTAGNVVINAPDSGNALEASGNILGETVFATGDNGGVLGATGLTNAVELVTSGTPTLVDSASVTGANTGYLKMYVGTQAIYVPYWT